MPSPALHLRAPLLWLLVPLLSGLAAARLWPTPRGGLGPLLCVAGLAGMGALWCALQPGRRSGLAWAVSLFLSAGLGGFILLQARHPALHLVESRPPREVTVTLHVLQAFPPAPTTRSLTGLAEITAAGETDGELLGRRIYFSAIRRISVTPQRSGHYVVRGVIEPLPRESAGTGLNAAQSPAPLPGASSANSTRSSPNPADAEPGRRRPNFMGKTPPQAAGNVSAFNDYLANLGIRQRLTRAQIVSESSPPTAFQGFCARAQDRLEEILRHGLEEQPQIASLYLAMLLGDKAVLSVEQESAFMRSGTFHIFSISGLHVGVVGTALYVLLNLLRVPRRPTVVVSLAALWLYVQITGASSPAVRAFLMIAFVLAAEVFRLPGNALAALAASALVTLLLDPLQLFSTGFQMSYTVVVALVVMGRPLSEKWLAAWRPFALLPKADWGWRHKAVERGGRWLFSSAAGCWTAFLASVPSGIGYFQIFSPGSLVANLIIIPLSFVAINAGFVSLLAGLVGLRPVSGLCNLAAARTIELMDWLLLHGIELPGVYFHAHFRTDWLAPASLVLMTAVLLAGAAGQWAKRYGGYWLPVGALALLLILGVNFG